MRIAAKLVFDEDVILIAPFATNPEVAKQGDNIIQICFSDEFQGSALARFSLESLGAKKILVLTNVESVYSMGLSRSFKRVAASLKKSPEIVDFQYTKKDLKLDELAKLLNVDSPDLIFVPDHIIRASVLIKKAHELNAKIRFLGGDGLGGRQVFLDVFGSTAGIELYYTGHWYEQLKGSRG